jgi:hypothetical protein
MGHSLREREGSTAQAPWEHLICPRFMRPSPVLRPLAAR